MEHLSNLIEEMRKGSTTSGIKRFQYMPYKLDIALSVVERIGKGINPQFSLSNDILPTYKELIRYFHGDPLFNGDLCKGIMLMGPTGTGKTLAMQIMAIYRRIDDVKYILNGKTYRLDYDIVDVNQLVNHFMESAFDGIDIYCRKYVTCLDDIGTESNIVKHYGNDLDVISHILAERYTRRLLTFGTTNFPTKVLEEKYDDRIVSRMFAMFNFITLKCADFRKIKARA